MQTTPKANNILGHFFALLGAIVMLAIATWVSASSSEQVQPLDNLAVPRTGHTATALSDGRILITGGRDTDGNLVAASEIFDPETQVSTAGATLNTARIDHSATVLADGKVLVAGGTGANGALSSAEIFDPAHPENGFQTVGSSMSTARTRHTATLLNDGHVLIAGGDAQGSAELFDPATGSFMPTIWPLTVARSGHTATLFTDDSVLLAGGNTATMETFVPNQGFTLDPATMSVVRTGHWAFELSDTRLLLFQGDTGNTIDEFNPAAGTITPKGSLDFHASSSSLLANGKVLVLGTDVSGLYNPDAVPPAPDFTAFDETSVPHSGILPRSGQSAVTLPGDKKILITGGVDGNNQLLGQALFNPAKIWTDKDDYAPDEPVILSASGWKANEAIYLFAVDNETEQWTYEMTVNADSNGEFILSPYFIVELRHAGVQFHVTAVGQSTMQADVYFTDSNPSTLTVTPPSLTVNAGSSASYTVAATGGGNGTNCPLNLSVTYAGPAPAGTTEVFGSNPMNTANGNGSTALNITTTNTGPPAGRTQPGTYNFTVTAVRGVGCQGSGNLTANGTLVVNANATTTTTVTSSSNPSIYGNSVTFTATVSSTTTPTGSVNFTIDGGAPIVGTPGATTATTATWTFATSTLTAGNHTVSASFTGTGSFGNSSGSVSGGQTVNAKHITGSFTAANKVYDGNTTATVLTRSLSGVIAPDVVTLTGGTATFDNKNVGTGKTVTLTGAALSGAAASNYILDSVATTTANITGLHITGSFTAANKIYDGNTTATVLTRSLSGVIAPDVVTLTGGTATFADKNVGNGKTVTLTGATLSGAGAGNYVLDSVATTTANITAKHITGSFTADNKVYDGNDSATVLTRSLSGVIAPDVVTLTGGTATFADKNVGMGKVVTLTGATLSGAGAGNYVLDSVATTTANITAKDLTINGAVADSKQYDGNADATVNFGGASLVGVIAPDMVTINSSGYSALFNNKNVGTAKPVTVTGVTLSGAEAGNYTVSQPSGLSADITAKNLTINGAVADSKQYDGNADATVNFGGASLVGVIAPDMVTINSSGYSANFNNKNVGTAKPVTVTGVTLSGGDAGNYSVSQPSGLTADITVLHITGTFTAANKIYDGNNSAMVLTRSLVGAISGDAVSLTGGTATFSDKTVGNGKTVTLTGATLSGGDASNYVLDSVATTTANITVLHITGTFTAANKVYDGNTSATVLTRSLVGAISGDAVSLTGGTATFSDKNVANGKTITLTGASLSGADAGNYVLDSVATTTANITPRPITVTADAKSKAYLASDPPLTYQVTSGSLVAGDTFSGALTRESGELPGTYEIQQGTLTVGTNYTLTYVHAYLTIGYGTCTGPNPSGVIQQPINTDGSSVFKKGSTVPVKFTVCGANGQPIGPDPSAVFATGYGSVSMVTYSRGTVGGVNETIVNDIPDSAFRWSTDKWIFNMMTSNLNAPATYTFRINLKGPLANGNSYIEFTIGTK